MRSLRGFLKGQRKLRIPMKLPTLSYLTLPMKYCTLTGRPQVARSSWSSVRSCWGTETRPWRLFAILDDGSERTILLHAAAQQLGLKGQSENITLHTVQQELQVIHGAAVSFTMSTATEPKRLHHIRGAFTAKQLGLAKHTHPVSALQRKFPNLKGLPLQHNVKAQPLLLSAQKWLHFEMLLDFPDLS